MQNPNWDGQRLGRDIVSGLKAYYATQPSLVNSWRTISLVNESNLPGLIGAIDTFAKALRVGVGLYMRKGDRTDNVQLAMEDDAYRAYRFDDPNFMDLYDFALRVKNDGRIPDCSKSGVDTIVTLLDSASPDGVRVVDTEDQTHNGRIQGAVQPALGGLSIYMPHYRTKPGLGMTIYLDNSGNLQIQTVVTDQAYDRPNSRISDGNSPIAIYNSNHDALPLAVLDMESGSYLAPDGTVLNPRTQWPSLPSPNLRFVQSTAWSLFLERYYHPVADNHIVNATSPDGPPIYPTATGGGVCLNSTDSISVPLGYTVNFTAIGSSDADISPAGSAISDATFAPLHFFWDPNDKAIDCGGQRPCVAPFGVPAGSDAALATDNVDADFDFNNTLFDENFQDSVTFSLKCTTPGTTVVTLTVWDDDHLYANHNTLPSAEYVHPQSNSNPASMTCAPLALGPPPRISDLQPAILLVGGPQIIRVDGVNFQAGLSVTVTPPHGSPIQLGGSQLLNFTPTSFQFSLTLSMSGYYSLVVTNPDGGVSSPMSFMVGALTPVVTGVSANLQPYASIQIITVYGGNFQSGLSVLINGPGISQQLTSGAISNLTSTSFQLNLSLPAVGNYSLVAVNPGNMQSNVFSFTVGSSAPALSAISPANPQASSSPQTLNVSGSGFQTGITLQLSGPSGTIPATAANVTGNGFQFSAALTSAGTYTLQVTSPTGQKSNTLTFTVNAPVAATPVITGTSPATLTASSNPQTLSVTGSGFQTGITLQLSGPSGTIPATAANVTGNGFQFASALTSAGTYTLQVTSPTGQKSNTLTFTVNATIAAPPVITGTSPATLTASSSPQTLSVTGSGFQTGITLELSGPSGTIPATAANVTGHGFQFAAALTSAGTYTLQVTSPTGQKSNTLPFTVSAPIIEAPAITGINPANPRASSNMQSFTVTGNGFQSGLNVQLAGAGGTINATAANVTATGFQFAAALTSAGTYTLQVTNANGQMSNPFTFVVGGPTTDIPALQRKGL